MYVHTHTQAGDSPEIHIRWASVSGWLADHHGQDGFTASPPGGRGLECGRCEQSMPQKITKPAAQDHGINWGQVNWGSETLIG